VEVEIPNRSRNWAYNAILALAATTATLGALELGFRIFDLRGYHTPRTREWEHALVPDAQRLPDVGIQFAPNTTFELNYDSNPRGYFDENDGLRYRINNYGFRGPDYPIKKPRGVQRIVLIGDSFAFGEGVRFEQTLGERLERLLNERGGDAAPVEILNLGVGGAGTLSELSFLRHRGIALEPDLVLWLYVLNDAGAAQLDLWENFTKQYERRWIRRSFLASYLYARVGRQILGRKYIDELVGQSKGQRKKWKRSMKRLGKAHDVARAAGAEFLVAIFPFMYRLDDGYPFRDFHDVVSIYCRNNDIDVLDLLPAFIGQTDTDLWVHPSDQHPNEIGHQIAAEALYPFVGEPTTGNH
jgi:lysophospholipase L1-like esterase